MQPWLRSGDHQAARRADEAERAQPSLVECPKCSGELFRADADGNGFICRTCSTHWCHCLGYLWALPSHEDAVTSLRHCDTSSSSS